MNVEGAELSHSFSQEKQELDTFKSEFAKQLNGGPQFTRQDLVKLKAENKSLQRKIESCWRNKNKYETLEHEIKLLRNGSF